MEVILNIGLDGIQVEPSFTNGEQNPATITAAFRAVQVARQLGFRFEETKLLRSDSEPTLVARVVCKNPNQDVAILAQHLNQDCIAVYDESSKRGALCGPRAERWGDFDPAFFFTLKGHRLADQQ